MKFRILCFCIVALGISIFMIEHCNSSNPSYKKTKYKEVNNIPGVSFMTSEKYYSCDVESIDVMLSNATDKRVGYGDTYTIEYFYKNKWVVIPFRKDIYWPDVMYFVLCHANKEITYKIKDNITINELKPGRYRIVIDVDIGIPRTLAAEFTVK